MNTLKPFGILIAVLVCLLGAGGSVSATCVNGYYDEGRWVPAPDCQPAEPPADKPVGSQPTQTGPAPVQPPQPEAPVVDQPVDPALPPVVDQPEPTSDGAASGATTVAVDDDRSLAETLAEVAVDWVKAVSRLL